MQLSLPFEISRVSEYFHFRNMFANRIEVYYVLIYNTIQARCSLVQEKNESVFLCPLEQDNQKNRKNTIEEINLDSIVQSSSIQQNSPAIGEKVLEDKGMPPTPGETNDLELLLREKAGLEEESRRLDEEQQRLDLLVRMHLEELALETKKRNGEKQKAIIDLRARVGMLETQLRGLSVLENSGEGIAKKIDNCPYPPSTEASREELFDSDQNAMAVEIIEEIK